MIHKPVHQRAQVQQNYDRLKKIMNDEQKALTSSKNQAQIVNRAQKTTIDSDDLLEEEMARSQRPNASNPIEKVTQRRISGHIGENSSVERLKLVRNADRVLTNVSQSATSVDSSAAPASGKWSIHARDGKDNSYEKSQNTSPEYMRR